MIIIPCMPEMIEAVEETIPDIDEDELHNNISGLFISFQGIGETSGPILGSLLQNFLGFRSSQDCAAITMLVFTIVYFSTCGAFQMFGFVDLN